MAEAERVLGAGHPDNLTSRNDLADAYRSVRLGRQSRYTKATLAARAGAGRDHSSTITV